VAAANSVFVSCIIIVGVGRGYLSASLTKEDRDNHPGVTVENSVRRCKIKQKKFHRLAEFYYF
ncbi:MAG: hypothetical protein K2L35_04605, partial [Muribaculaceae bacterium]|nr:hypothetical protein [Muribaculaceae bacterium]